MTTTQPDLPQQLGNLANHLATHPDLPPWYAIHERRNGHGGYEGLELHLWASADERLKQHGDPAAALAAWAGSLPGFESVAHRYPDHVVGHITSRLYGYPIEIHAELPDDAVPADTGNHRWEPVLTLDQALAPHTNSHGPIEDVDHNPTWEQAIARAAMFAEVAGVSAQEAREALDAMATTEENATP